jgi:hypothetical protein
MKALVLIKKPRSRNLIIWKADCLALVLPGLFGHHWSDPAAGISMMAVPPIARGYREHQRLMQTDPEYAGEYQQAFSG